MKLRNKRTGEIVDAYSIECPDSKNIKLRLKDRDVNFVFYSIKSLNVTFEDYAPKEPLIKDEKIRKAVRAWAEANDYPKTMELYYNAPNYVLRSDISTIEFDKEIEPLQHGEQHTIAELCGEEE